jgi:hypothetical protein
MRRLTYSNVVATIALFLALAGGTSAIALSGRNTVRSDDIVKGGVRAADIRDGAVGVKDLGVDSVTAAALADGAVSSGEITGGAVGRAELGSGAVATGEVADASLTGADLADGSLTGADLADGSLSAADLAANAVTAGVYSARVNGLGSGVTLYASVSGTSTPVAGSPSNVLMVSPAAALKATDFAVKLSVAPSPGTRSVSLFVNGLASDLACTVNAGATSCTDSDLVSLPAASDLSLRFENVGGVSDTAALVSFRLVGP